MGMDLYNADGGRYFRFSIGAWRSALALASEYGWEHWHTPAYYMVNDGQPVSADEADEIADALERALPNVPDEGPARSTVTPEEYQWAHEHGELPPDLTGEELRERMLQAVMSTTAAPEPERLEEEWAGSRDYLEKFVEFCRYGEFNVY